MIKTMLVLHPPNAMTEFQRKGRQMSEKFWFWSRERRRKEENEKVKTGQCW